MSEVIIKWEQVCCGNFKIDNWIAKVVSPVETVEFAAVFRTIDGLWRADFTPKGRAINHIGICVDYPAGRDRAMADVEKWGKANWRRLSLSARQSQPKRW